jgi:Glycosyltransferase family 87
MQRIVNLNLRPWIWLAGITLLTTVCVWGLLAIAPWENMVPDFVCYWTAGALIASGHSPYDVGLQTEIQRRCGWDKSKDGLGKFDFLPYYYPPWFAAGCALLLPLGYQGAKIAWFLVNLELLLVTAYLLRDAVPGLPRSIPLATVPIFTFSVIALFVGQTLIMILFLVAIVWRLLQRGSDYAAGAALACLTTKPQLTGVLVLALLLWSARQRRWAVAHGFVLALAALGLASALILPWWPIEMLQASQKTLPPTTYFPWIGTTWFLILKTIGLSSWGLWVPYLGVAIPFLILVTWQACDRSHPLEDIIALGLLAPFIVAPYGRHYDFPVLLIPMYVLLARRLSEISGAILLFALVILPYIHFGVLVRFRQKYPSNVRLFPEFTFFWVPLLLVLIWLATEASAALRRQAALVTACADGASSPSDQAIGHLSPS